MELSLNQSLNRRTTWFLLGIMVSDSTINNNHTVLNPIHTFRLQVYY
jgi:hypothetical protein